MTITLPRIAGLTCRDVHEGFICTRAKGHEGRHAATVMGRRVARVWGDDIHATRRARSRGSSFDRVIAHIDRALETAHTWDGVAR